MTPVHVEQKKKMGLPKSINIVVENKNMKTLKFRQVLAKEILDGRKTITWRLFDDKDLKVGDKLDFLEWETKNKFAEAEIIGIREKKLVDIEDEDLEGHEKFKDKEEMLETYKKYYGDRTSVDTVVKIISFNLLRV